MSRGGGTNVEGRQSACSKQHDNTANRSSKLSQQPQRCIAERDIVHLLEFLLISAVDGALVRSALATLSLRDEPDGGGWGGGMNDKEKEIKRKRK